MRLSNALGAAALLFVGLALAECSGGGHDAVTPGQLAGPAATPTGLVAQSVTITVNIPGQSSLGTARKAQYVGAGTQSATFIATPSGAKPGPGTTVNCTSTCQATLAVFPGSVTFTVTLYNATNGTGAVLSTGSTTQMIVAGQTTNVNITFNGVPASVALTVNPATLPVGTAATSAVTVAAKDASGNTIVAPGAYTSTIALTSAQASVSFSPSTVTGPGQAVTLSYSGATVSAGTVVPLLAAIGGGAAVQAGALTLNTPSPAPTPTTVAACPTPASGLFPMSITNNTGVSGAITVYAYGLLPPSATTWQYLTSPTTGALATLPASGTAIPGFALPANGCIDFPPLISARVYLALGGAQFANFVSNGAGSGAGGVAPWAPTQANANINVVYDFLEYTWKNTSAAFGVDVTQIDSFNIPISFQAVNSSGSPAASPVYGMQSKALTNLEADLATLGTTWTGLIQQTGTGFSRVISPQHAYNIPADGVSPPPLPYPSSAPTFGKVNYWDVAIASIWATYRATDQGENFLAMSYQSFGTAYGLVNPATNMFNFYSSPSTSSTLLGSVPYPTTWDVFNNAGAFAVNASGQQGVNLGRALVVNIERGTLPLPVPLYVTWPPASELQPFCNGLTNMDWKNFYGGPSTNFGTKPTSSSVTNWYAALMHKYGQQPISGLPGLAYAFPDDDECQAAGGGLYDPFYGQAYTAGEQWNVTLNPF